MKKYKYIKKYIQIDSPIEVFELFKSRIKYDKRTGILYNKHTNKYYSNVNKKGYISPISIRYNNVEYSWISHRLVWYLMTNEILESSIQIDHINRIKTDNRFNNLRKCTNSENQYNTRNRSCTSSYKGVFKNIDVKPSGTYNNFCANVCKEGKSMMIGRFKDEIKAAMYYDSAARYYFKEFANCNFNIEHIPSMNINDLRKYKKEHGD